MSQIENFEPDDFILGPDQPVTAVGTLKSGTTVTRLTPVAIDSDDPSLFVVWDGYTDAALGLAAFDLTASSDTEFSYYAKGSFRSSAIPWPQIPTGTTPRDMTEAEKQAAFAGTAISVG